MAPSGNIRGIHLERRDIGFSAGVRYSCECALGIAGSIFGYFSSGKSASNRSAKNLIIPVPILYCVGLLTILIGTDYRQSGLRAQHYHHGRRDNIICIAILVAFRQEHPTLDVKLFKIRAFAAGTMASFLNSSAFALRPVFTVFIFKSWWLGYSPMKTGLLLIPMEILILFSAHQRPASDRIGSRVLTCLGLAVNASALFWFSTAESNSSYSAILRQLILFGIGISRFRFAKRQFPLWFRPRRSEGELPTASA